MSSTMSVFPPLFSGRLLQCECKLSTFMYLLPGYSSVDLNKISCSLFLNHVNWFMRYMRGPIFWLPLSGEICFQKYPWSNLFDILNKYAQNIFQKLLIGEFYYQGKRITSEYVTNDHLLVLKQLSENVQGNFSFFFCACCFKRKSKNIC